MYKLNDIFPNVCMALQIFCTLAVKQTSHLKLTKSFLMTQERLNDLSWEQICGDSWIKSNKNICLKKDVKHI